MNISAELREISTFLITRKKYVDKELKKCPPGCLRMEKQHGENHLVQSTTVDGMRHRRNLTPDDPDYEQFTYRPEEKRHITSRGLKVRSKSELLIIEQLYDYLLPTRYEQVIHIDGYNLAPDFTIRRADGKIFYWEHEGLTNETKYLERQIKKSQIYASAGIVPWDNLIVTYDTADGNIDLRIIKATIESRLII